MISVNFNLSPRHFGSKKFVSFFLHGLAIACPFTGAVFINRIGLSSTGLSFGFTLIALGYFLFGIVTVYSCNGMLLDKDKRKYCLGAIPVCASIGTLVLAFETIDVFP